LINSPVFFGILAAAEKTSVGMAKDANKKVEEVNGVPVERQGTRPDFSIPPPRKQLPKELQDTLNDEEKLWEVLYDGEYVISILPSAYLPS
jgi:hypothetical protein